MREMLSEGLVGDLLMSLIYYTVHISLGILGVSDGHRIFVAQWQEVQQLTHPAAQNKPRTTVDFW